MFEIRARNAKGPSPFGQRLKDLRRAMDYTQAEMAHALGIRTARYSKYEVGRSEAPYEVLIKISRLTSVSIDYLVSGEEPRRSRRTLREQLRDLLDHLPTSAVIYDNFGKLFSHNRLYQETFFPDHPRLIRPGVEQRVVLRAWAYAQGCDASEAEEFVRMRLASPRADKVHHEFQIGRRRIQIAESKGRNYKLVLATQLKGIGASTRDE